MLYKLVMVLCWSIGETPYTTLVRATLIIALASAGFLDLGAWLTFSAQSLIFVITPTCTGSIGGERQVIEELCRESSSFILMRQRLLDSLITHPMCKLT